MRDGYFKELRVARTTHECYDCGKAIEPGQRYMEIVAPPRYEYNPRPGHWTRAAVCVIEAPVIYR